jgi:hypothetical protein
MRVVRRCVDWTITAGGPRTHPEAALLRPGAKAVRRMLDIADVVWLSTNGLAEQLAAIRPDAVVLANGLDERIWTPSAIPAPDQPVRSCAWEQPRTTAIWR